MSDQVAVAPAPFDFAKLDISVGSNAGAEFRIVNPRTSAPYKNSDGTPLYIRLLGRYSDAFVGVNRAIGQRKLGRGNQPLSPEEMDAENAEQLAAVTCGWNIESLDGQPFPCNSANALKLWSDPRFKWLIIPALNFVFADANFLAP